MKHTRHWKYTNVPDSSSALFPNAQLWFQPKYKDCFRFDDSSTALAQREWLNHVHWNNEHIEYEVLKRKRDYLVCPKGQIQDSKYDLFENWANWNELEYEDLEHINANPDDLLHWSKLIGSIRELDSELLLYLVLDCIPLLKFMRYELQSRGLDQHGKWVGLEKAKEIWFG